MNDVLKPIFAGNYSADDVDAVVAEIVRLRTLVKAAPELLEALQLVSMCCPVKKDLEAMPDDEEVSLTFVAEDLKQIRAAVAKAVAP